MFSNYNLIPENMVNALEHYVMKDNYKNIKIMLMITVGILSVQILYNFLRNVTNNIIIMFNKFQNTILQTENTAQLTEENTINIIEQSDEILKRINLIINKNTNGTILSDIMKVFICSGISDSIIESMKNKWGERVFCSMRQSSVDKERIIGYRGRVYSHPFKNKCFERISKVKNIYKSSVERLIKLVFENVVCLNTGMGGDDKNFVIAHEKDEQFFKKELWDIIIPRSCYPIDGK
jgi:hypothetical protein